MAGSGFSFRVDATAGSSGPRRGLLKTWHGSVETPAFMPVASRAVVKGLDVSQLRQCGTQMLLANTYHLALRPGGDVVEKIGGLHAFMGWDGPILTDSGGYQIVSLADRAVVTESGVVFRSHIDGSRFELTPEAAIRVQQQLGSDIAMVLDHVVPLPSSDDVVRAAMERTVRWARRCRDAAQRDGQTLFGIVQGGLSGQLRESCAAELVRLDLAGYAVGGLSVGEKNDEMLRTIEQTTAVLPEEKPRYLMGVGRPQDLIEAVDRGIDLFDCVLPTRNGRNAVAFTAAGPVRLKNLRFREDDQPLESDCPCPACCHSRAYLRHLFMVGDMLGCMLLSAHNITYYQSLLSQCRASIEAGRFRDFRDQTLRALRGGESAVA
jgi:queuine tRNA-ribosyltransferase